MYFQFREIAVFVGLSVSVISCSVDPVEEPETKAPETVTAPEVKPVKIPPTVEKKGRVDGIGIDEVFPIQQSGEALIYDVRDPYFYNIDHIEGAINWPPAKYEELVQERDIEIQKAIAAGKEVVLYCFNLGCPEARNMAKKLARRDYEVRTMTMGIDSWRNAGLPLVNGAGEATQ